MPLLCSIGGVDLYLELSTNLIMRVDVNPLKLAVALD